MKAQLIFLLFLCACTLEKPQDEPATPRLLSIIEAGVEAIPITSGPKQHWLGYYDKWQVNASGRYAVANEADVFFRSPQASDTLKVGLIDLDNNYQWKQIGTSNAWGWQQANMLQWIPGSSEEVIWNDWGGEKYVARVYNITTEEMRTLPKPIYTLAPNGKFALTTDFTRLQDMRPGYGYPGHPNDPKLNEKTPRDQGVYKMDLETGESQLIFSYADFKDIPREMGATPVDTNFHWFNHLLISPDSKRFFFLNRSRPYRINDEMREEEDWQKKYVSAKHVSRAFTANTDGSDLYLLNDAGYFSHFVWDGERYITAWAKPEGIDVANFYRFKDQTKEYQVVDSVAMPENGHNTYVPNTNNEWILNDTYPDEDRLQTLYVYHVPTRTKVILGRFLEPEQFYSEWRVDLHPRTDQQGDRIFFDSTHEGAKRQVYMIEIKDILESADKKYTAISDSLRNELEKWQKSTNDLGNYDPDDYRSILASRKNTYDKLWLERGIKNPRETDFEKYLRWWQKYLDVSYDASSE